MYNILDFKVCNDGSRLVTAEIQQLIDRCKAEKGGTIVFPAGSYLTGGLELCSNLKLILEAGATLLGSMKLEDYKLYSTVEDYPFDEGQDGVRAILFARNCHNLCVEGPGTVRGGGKEFDDCGTRRARPRNILFAGCSDIRIRDLQLEESGFWNQHYLQCQRVRIEGERVRSLYGTNNDGIDIDSCCDVIIRNCRIDSQDDAICLKSSTRVPCENVIVSDCITSTHANHFKLGTESHGGFRHVRASNIIMVPSELPVSTHVGGGDRRGASGIALGAIDGAFIEDVVVENVTMEGVRVPFFLRHGDCGRTYPGMPAMPPAYVDGVTLRHITAHKASTQGCFLIGLPEVPMRNVTVEDCDLEFEGGVPREWVDIDVPDKRTIRCDMEAFGNFSCYGIFSRYIDGLTLRNIRFSVLAPDPRPAIQYQLCTKIHIDNIQEMV